MLKTEQETLSLPFCVCLVSKVAFSSFIFFSLPAAAFCFLRTTTWLKKMVSFIVLQCLLVVTLPLSIATKHSHDGIPAVGKSAVFRISLLCVDINAM